jgi:hypothetical protein
MRTTYKALLLLIVWLAPAWAVLAQDMDKDSPEYKLMRFAANNEDFDRRVETAAKEMFRNQINCGATEQTLRQLPTLYGKLAFDGPRDGFAAPTYGLWAEHVKVRACGKLWQINMLAVAQRNANPLLLGMLPGETFSDPGAQRDAERIGATSIRKSDDTCADEARAFYTRFLGYKQADGTLGKTNQNQGWFEEWDFKFCQKIVPIQMAFVPNTAGGFDIKTRLVNAANPQTPASKPPAPVSPATPPATPAQ